MSDREGFWALPLAGGQVWVDCRACERFVLGTDDPAWRASLYRSADGRWYLASRPSLQVSGQEHFSAMEVQPGAVAATCRTNDYRMGDSLRRALEGTADPRAAGPAPADGSRPTTRERPE